jgi:hypothetical protein
VRFPNAVALISLAVAVCCLSDITWRNEATGDNCNLRVAAFEVLPRTGELRQVVFHVHYDRDLDKGSPRIGWACVLTISGLARILPDKMQDATAALLLSWGENREHLADSTVSLDIILQALDATRSQTLVPLRSLE